MNQWTIVSRQIGRNGFRSFLMGAGGGLFAAVLVTVTLLGVGINQSIRQTVNRLGADLMVVPHGEEIAAHFNDALVTGRPAAFYLPRALEASLAAHAGVAQVSTQTFAQTLTNARCCAGSFFLVGFDRGSDFTVQPWLSEPMLELPDDALNWILVGDRILLKPGESVDLYGSTFRVAGVLAPTGMGMDWSIYLPHSALDRLVEHSISAAESPLRIPARHVSAFFIRAAEGVDLIDLAEELERDHPSIQVVLSSSVGKRARSQLALTAAVSLILLAVVWLVAALLSGVVFSQAIRERRGEFGLFLAKGARRGFILALLAKEALLISLSACLVGAAFALLVLLSFRQLLSGTLGVPDCLPGPLSIALLMVALVALGSLNAVLCSLVPAISMLRTEPYEAIKGTGKK